MALPDEIRMAITTEGLTFELRVSALPRGCARLFPSPGCADEFRESRDLPLAVAQAAACALDVAVSRFLEGFEASLVRVLTDKLDGKVGAGETAPEQEPQMALSLAHFGRER